MELNFKYVTSPYLYCPNCRSLDCVRIHGANNTIAWHCDSCGIFTSGDHEEEPSNLAYHDKERTFFGQERREKERRSGKRRIQGGVTFNRGRRVNLGKDRRKS